ncbi:MAG TPA: C1 family peptidase [Bacilli bacterium]|nr:C1 family peptidase [Bacilli bacterium]
MNNINDETLKVLQKSYDKKPKHQVLKRVLYQTDLGSIFTKQEEARNNHFLFSNEIKTLPITNQKQTGRCWIFAGLNVLREIVAKKFGLKDFELSQNYTALFDKLEKINYFIESIDDFLEVDSDDRTFQHILKTGIQDGGQWDMFVSVIEKYGVVPQIIMPETDNSSNTRFINKLIDLKLRQYAADVRKIKTNKPAIKALKAKTLDELYSLLISNFGEVPTTFDFEYVNDEGFHIIKDLTPQKFYHEIIGDVLSEYISVINAPTSDKPFHKTFTVAYLGNVVGGGEIKYLNLPINELKELIITQLKSGELVWFGSDVATYGDRVTGFWDDASFDYENVLDMHLEMAKADQLVYSQGAMNHAMLLTGVHLDGVNAKRWKIENSWGNKGGKDGYYVCSDTWFDKFVYQGVINKKHLSKEQLAMWNQAPIVLKPWDPMGSLAD